jgi:hypothetical protein
MDDPIIGIEVTLTETIYHKKVYTLNDVKGLLLFRSLFKGKKFDELDTDECQETIEKIKAMNADELIVNLEEQLSLSSDLMEEFMEDAVSKSDMALTLNFFYESMKP